MAISTVWLQYSYTYYNASYNYNNISSKLHPFIVIHTPSIKLLIIITLTPSSMPASC